MSPLTTNAHRCDPPRFDELGWLSRGRGRQLPERVAMKNLAAVIALSLAVSPVHAQVIDRASVASDGTQGNGASLGGALSADGRFVAFVSSASNLVPGDTNGA